MGGYTALYRLVRVTELRAIAKAIRGSPERFEPPDSPDLALIDPVDDPFESVSDATQRLATLESRLRERGDRRAVFLTIYVRMTREVDRGIDSGQFNDPEWMRRYLVTFANYYRRAFRAFETGALDAVPDPWRVAFGASMHRETLAVQDAFLGVNAHINYDLALTLDEVDIDPNRDRKYEDHLAIDDILAGLVDAQQRALAEVYAPWVENVDGVFGQLDEALTLRSMTEGREQAWRVAVVRTDVSISPIPSLARRVLNTTATGLALLLLSPQVEPAVLEQLRRAEQDRTSLDAILRRVDDELALEGR